jgi:Zn-dependent protease
MNLFISYLWKDPYLFVTLCFIVIFSVCCHEFIHAYTALKFGDTTAADRGHLTLNPLKQMGLGSLIMLAFLGLAWGQVPVDTNQMKGKYAPAAVAFSGPFANFVLGILFAIGAFTCVKNNIDNRFAINMLYFASIINFVLFMINLLPIPGFDGLAILHNIFPKLFNLKSEFMKGTYIVAICLVFFVINKFYSAAEYIFSVIVKVLEKIA